MKKKAIILVGILLISFVFMAEAGALYSRTISQTQCPGYQYYADDTKFEFTDVPNPRGDGTLTVGIQGDYNGEFYLENVEVIVEGTSLGKVLGEYDGEECGSELLTKTYIVTRSQINQWMADGKIEVTLVQGGEVDCYCSTNINIVTLEYPTGSLPMLKFMKILGLGRTD